MITYECPKCGNNLEQIVLTSLPPIHVFKCNKCGFKEEERQQVRYMKYQYKSIHVGNGVWIREDELKRIQ